MSDIQARMQGVMEEHIEATRYTVQVAGLYGVLLLALLATATPKQVKLVRQVVSRLGTPSDPNAKQTRDVMLQVLGVRGDKVEVEELADEIQRLADLIDADDIERRLASGEE